MQRQEALEQNWLLSSDSDARIGSAKIGSFRLLFKAEHAVDVNAGVILSAQVHHGDHRDTQALGDTVSDMVVRFEKSGVGRALLAWLPTRVSAPRGPGC